MPRGPADPPSRRLPAALLAAALCLLAPAPEVSAQALDVAGGTVVGAAGGAVVSLALVAGSARAGRYLFSPDPLRWEALPVPLAALAGGIAGHRDPEGLWRSVGWGAGGLALGSLAGAAVGRLVWGTSDGAWTGVLLGGATGAVAGVVLGSLSGEETRGDAAPLRLRIPLGP